jgi:hypothetical protein
VLYPKHQPSIPELVLIPLLQRCGGSLTGQVVHVSGAHGVPTDDMVVTLEFLFDGRRCTVWHRDFFDEIPDGTHVHIKQNENGLITITQLPH